MYTLTIVILFAATYLTDDLLNDKLRLGQKLLDLWEALNSADAKRSNRRNREG